MLGISFDDAAANAAFVQKFSFPYKLLCDTDRKVGLLYGACTDKTAGYANRISYLIDGNGKIMQTYPKVSPADHPAQVLADAARA